VGKCHGLFLAGNAQISPATIFGKKKGKMQKKCELEECAILNWVHALEGDLSIFGGALRTMVQKDCFVG
jgi:hypothetical protein